MGLRMGKYKKWLGYVLFAAIVSGAFLYFCFPSEAVRQYVEGSATRFHPALALSVNGLQPAFPFGLKLENTDLGLSERPGISLFKADSLVVMPSIRVLTLRRPAIRFDCRAYGGNIQGVIALKTFSLGGPIESDIQITGVHLGQHQFLKEWFKRELTGEMSGTVTYSGSQDSFIRGSGKGDFSIANGSVQLSQPFLGVESVDFQRIDAQMVLEKQRISLARFDFKGKLMEGNASGSIHLNPNLPKSRLDLKVTVKALGDKAGLFDAVKFLGQRFKEGIFEITIGGTFDQPQINFI